MNTSEKSVFHTIKIPAKRVIRDVSDLPILNDFAITKHSIKEHLLKFMKAYLLNIQIEADRTLANNINDYIDENGNIDPNIGWHSQAYGLNHTDLFDVEVSFDQIINKNLIKNMIHTICEPPTQGQGGLGEANRNLRNELRLFHDNFYQPTRVDDGISRENLTTSIDYTAEEILTMYENNIMLHFKDHVIRFLENVYNKRERKRYMNSAEKKRFDREFDKIKADVLCTQYVMINGQRIYNYMSDQNHHGMIEILKRLCLPRHVRIAPSNYNIEEDLKVSQLKYFTKMITMGQYVEGNDGKLLTVFPLITTTIPGHSRIDTTTLAKLWYPRKNEDNDYVKNRMNNVDIEYILHHIKKCKHKLWDSFLKIKENKEIFHGVRYVKGEPQFGSNGNPRYVDNSDYTFHGQITTNGYEIGVILVLKTKAHILHPKNPPKNNNVKDPSDMYIHNIPEQLRLQLQDKNIAAFDPNIEDLFVGINSNIKDDKQKYFRFTKIQRATELKTKEKRKKLNNEKKSTFINGQTIEELERDLSHHNSKTLNLNDFRDYCHAKNIYNQKAGPNFYQDIKYRKRKFSSFIDKQKCDAKLVKNIKKNFGKPKKCVIAWGDWNERKYRGYRRLLRKAGYSVFLVNEFRTSLMCSECSHENGKLRKFRRVKYPRPNKYRSANRNRFDRYAKIVCHGLLRCTTCKRLWNRDINAPINIWKAARNALDGNPRPPYLCRQPHLV